MSEFQPGAYDIERDVFSGKFRSLLERKDGMTVADQRAIADLLTAHFSIEPIVTQRIKARTPSYGSHASYETRTITMGALAGPAVVCHEVAHILCGKTGSSKADGDGYHHGQTWQAHYVTCVRVAISDYHANRLAKAFAKFEEDKAKNLARAAVKRGKRRSATKSGPRVRTVVKSDITGAFYVSAMGKASYVGRKGISLLAIRYSTNKGWYWRVCGYRNEDLPNRAYNNVWESLARNGITNIRPVFAEGQFSTKMEALEWGWRRADERTPSVESLQELLRIH